MCQYSVKIHNSEFFGPNLGKLPNFVQYFGSNDVEDVAESWAEVEMSWVEVDGAGWRWVYGLVILLKFSNEIKKCAKVRLLNLINDIEQVFPMGNAIKQ